MDSARTEKIKADLLRIAREVVSPVEADEIINSALVFIDELSKESQPPYTAKDIDKARLEVFGDCIKLSLLASQNQIDGGLIIARAIEGVMDRKYGYKKEKE